MFSKHHEKWTLALGLRLIRKIQPTTRLYGYHLCLGGGVLNKGFSLKDLDLYFLPLEDRGATAQEDQLLGWLRSIFGEGKDIAGDGEYLKEKGSLYARKIKFQVGTSKNLRIDVFIMGGAKEDA